QVMKTRSQPSSTSSTSSRFSSMACRPISGRAPAPNPLVSFLPIWIFTSDLEAVSACESVLTETKSTPRSCSSIMRLTALPPPPPTPITFIRALCAPESSSSKIMGCPIWPTSEKVLEPAFHRCDPLLDRLRPPAAGSEGASLQQLLGPVEREPGRHREPGRLDAVGKAGQPLTGDPYAHRHCEDFATQLHHARNQGTTA